MNTKFDKVFHHISHLEPFDKLKGKWDLSFERDPLLQPRSSSDHMTSIKKALNATEIICTRLSSLSVSIEKMKLEYCMKIPYLSEEKNLLIKDLNASYTEMRKVRDSMQNKIDQVEKSCMGVKKNLEISNQKMTFYWSS